jgi:hypothetical protein
MEKDDEILKKWPSPSDNCGIPETLPRHSVLKPRSSHQPSKSSKRWGSYRTSVVDPDGLDLQLLVESGFVILFGPDPRSGS